MLLLVVIIAISLIIAIRARSIIKDKENLRTHTPWRTQAYIPEIFFVTRNSASNDLEASTTDCSLRKWVTRRYRYQIRSTIQSHYLQVCKQPDYVDTPARIGLYGTRGTVKPPTPRLCAMRLYQTSWLKTMCSRALSTSTAGAIVLMAWLHAMAISTTEQEASLCCWVSKHSCSIRCNTQM